MAAMFDADLLQEIGDVVATEGRAKFHESIRQNDRDIYKGLTFWSPNINIFRDPRWGRGHETYGEDPYLTSRLGVAYIRGLQGDGKYLKTAACAKHYAVHSGPERRRHSFDAKVSPKDLEETYLPAFEAAVREAKVESVMGAYNRTNGEPCCGSKTLIQDILREKWEFDGHFVSDCGAIADFHLNHHVTHTAPESAAMAVNNGCDLNCGRMYGYLLAAHAEGLISEETITESVIRLMETRIRLGLFDDDCEYADIPFEKNDCAEHHELALKAARRSMVLLRNNGILPLNRDQLKTVAVIGPNADSRAMLLGNYNGTPSQYITILDGIREAILPQTRLYYAQGCHLVQDMEGLNYSYDSSLRMDNREAEAVSTAERADVVVLLIDATEGVTEQDAKIAGIAHERGKGMIIAVNKWDALEKDDKTIYRFTEKVRNTLAYMPYAELLFISAKTGQRLPKLFETIDMVLQYQNLRVQTGVLNEILTEAMAMQQPPSDRGKRLKIYYMTQVSVKPPTFVIFVNDKELMHFSYVRYLENKIRESFGFRGTPLKFIIRERKEKEQ